MNSIHQLSDGQINTIGTLDGRIKDDKLTSTLREQMCRNESANNANVGLENGSVDVDIEIVEIVDNHIGNATEL